MDKGKKINWKNGLLLSAVSYLLYIIIWLVLDYETARQLPEMALIDYNGGFPAVYAFHIHLTGILLYRVHCVPVQSLLCQGHRICLVPADAQQSGGFRYDLTF